MKILMVCLGNICRSPVAEAILRHKCREAGLSWTIESCGTNGFHVGEPPHKFSQKVALSHGIDISQQCARRFVKEDLKRFDKVYAMAADVLDEMREITGEELPANVDLFLNELHPGKNKDVPDPWYGGEEGFHTVHALIDQACDSIIKKELSKAQSADV